MVSKGVVIALMEEYLPKCPICGAEDEYEVSGVFKNYVQCKLCLAKWMSNDFIGGIEIKTLQLWEADKEGKSKALVKQTKPVSFWQSLDLEKLVALEKETFGTLKGILFDGNMSDEEIETKIMELQNEAAKSEGAVSSLPVVSALLKGGDPRLTGMFVLLQGIYQQNKIIVLQNELLRRKSKL